MTARLAVELFVLAVLVTAACAWTALVLVEETLRQSTEDELSGMVAGIEDAVATRRALVVGSLGGVEEALLADAQLLERFLTEDPGLAGEATRLTNRYPLVEFLEILNDQGKILSRAPDEEKIGLMDDDFGAVPTDEAKLFRWSVAGVEKLYLLTRRERRVGLRTLVLVGGADFDLPFVQQVAGNEAAVLLEPTGDGTYSAISSARGTALGAPQLAPLIASHDGPLRLQDAGGHPWLVDLAPLDRAPDAPRAWIGAAVDLGRIEGLRKRLLDAFTLLACGVGLVAAFAGAWIARRTSRPVGDLVRAFDAIAHGEADYSFSIRAQDEMEEVVASFSRLHRAFEEQRQRAVAMERVAAWREVARHVAHEVKNPLAPIRLTVENLLRARTQAPQRFEDMFREGMQTILDEVQQLTRMVGEFAEFARLPLPALRPVALEELIDRVVELYASEPGVRVVKDVAPGLPAVELDADQISRALKNVVGNAIEAAREGRAVGQAEVVIRAGVRDGVAEITVLDNGPGFSPEAERRLFEPYFTTKPHGVGLGMALTYRIVIEHGGVIFAENRPGPGASVVIRLPLHAAAPPITRAREENLA